MKGKAAKRLNLNYEPYKFIFNYSVLIFLNELLFLGNED